MRDIVKEYQKKFRRNHQRARRYTALLLALAAGVLRRKKRYAA